MKIRDFLHLDVDLDIADDVREEVCIGFVGPISLTEEGKKHFAKALDLDIEFAGAGDYAVVEVGRGSVDVWKENIKAAKELFNAAAGYCSEGQWIVWFKNHIDVSIRYEDILTIEKFGWSLLSIEEQDDNVIVEIENSSPLGEDVVEDIWLEDGDSLEAAAYKWADSFDVDDHVKLWVEHLGENGVPDSIEALVEDAKDIQKMICDLARAFGDTDEAEDEAHAPISLAGIGIGMDDPMKNAIKEVLVSLLAAYVDEKDEAEYVNTYERGYADGYHDAIVDVMQHIGIQTSELHRN